MRWLDPDTSGPRKSNPRPEAKICFKCQSVSLCIGWEEFPPPWVLATPLYVNFYECPVHGYFEEHDGKQVFDDPDVWITGPDGRKLFAL